ncbi:hypothetical protein pEaSNUABM56_00083 [Erwinia phage pEa_SNUABM_56]|uniref:Uncharacterized protein n=1 Tax=Erwinia phage pEp_SNUABM_01 TaxID=2601643 RepID=A0A5J6DAH5_9CAUD|nr:hypothetical protein HWC63_gp056 [Erwinia phage pEp_SNUABM_01]QEQ94882.1 hypothetical protein pEpSNUABM01_056 [Erwinia phage pEp_SNUABM_01]UYL84813.1 hypothetical protein pEaSNUABM55_00015 [Erwinia phage pEa_SNUABM_55]UYL85128.1 hypothetical protein pEaSNUABM56_00083 [Erwinia phage pEa_SNUABM_56]
MGIKYNVQGYYPNAREPGWCDWVVNLDREKAERLYHQGKIVSKAKQSLFTDVRLVEVSSQIVEPMPFIWRDAHGFQSRVSHMSNEHINNAITWLLYDQSGPEECFSDLDEQYEGHTIGDWINHLTNELYRRIGA